MCLALNVNVGFGPVNYSNIRMYIANSEGNRRSKERNETQYTIIFARKSGQMRRRETRAMILVIKLESHTPYLNDLGSNFPAA